MKKPEISCLGCSEVKWFDYYVISGIPNIKDEIAFYVIVEEFYVSQRTKYLKKLYEVMWPDDMTLDQKKRIMSDYIITFLHENSIIKTGDI